MNDEKVFKEVSKRQFDEFVKLMASAQCRQPFGTIDYYDCRLRLIAFENEFSDRYYILEE